MRMLTSEARIDAHRFRSGYLNEKDYGRLSHALGTLAEARVFIDDTASIGVLEMRAKARRLKAEHGLHLLIIDYIQLMQGRGRFESRQAELASISRSLKGLAKELKRPDRRAVAARRARPKTRSDHRPQLSDLRESGALEQDADVVMFIYREEQYRDADGQAEPGSGRHRRDHHRQAAQRPVGTVEARVHQGAHAVREPRAGRRVAAGWRSEDGGRSGRLAATAMIDRPLLASISRQSLPTCAQSSLLSPTSNLRPPTSQPPCRAQRRAIIAVVKANAYGHGAAEVGLALEDAGRGDARVRRHRGRDRPAPRRRARADPGLRRPRHQRPRRRVRARPDADDLDAVGGARAAGRGREARRPNCAAT